MEEKEIEELMKISSAGIMVVGGAILVGVVKTSGVLEIQPLTEEKADVLGFNENFQKLVKAHEKATQELMESGNLLNEKWLQEHIDVQLSEELTKQSDINGIVARFRQNLFSTIQKDASQNGTTALRRWAAMFADSNPESSNGIRQKVIFNIEKSLGRGVAGSADAGIQNVNLDVYQKDIPGFFNDILPHEVVHMGQIPFSTLNPEEAALNPREAVVASNVQEACARIGDYVHGVLEGRNPLGKNEGRSIEQMLKDVNPDLSLKDFLALREKNPEQFNQYLNKISRQAFLDYMKSTPRNPTYRKGQFLEFALSARLTESNMDGLKQQCESYVKQVGLDIDDVWPEIEAYASGKKEMPGMEEVFTKEGLLQNNVRNGYILRQLWYAKQEGASDRFNFLKNKLSDDLKAVFGIGDGMQCNDNQLKCFVDSNGVDVLGDEPLKMIRSFLQSQNRTKELAKYDRWLRKLGLDVDPYKILNSTAEADLRAFVRARREEIHELLAQDPPKKPSQIVHQDVMRRKNMAEGILNVGKTLVNVGGRWMLMTGAGKVGQAFLPDNLMGMSDARTPAQKKADAALAAAGLTTIAGSAVVAAASAVGSKAVTKGAGKVVAKSVPVVGTFLGVGWAARRAWDGDWTGAGLEVASAACDLVSAVGVGLSATGGGAIAGVPLTTWAAGTSLTIDTGLAVRDGMMKNGVCAFAMTDADGNELKVKDENGNETLLLGSRITYKNNNKDGSAEFYSLNENGTSYKAMTGFYKNDKKEGQWQVFSPDGKVLEHYVYKEGQLVQFVKDTENGKILGQFTDGKPSGTWMQTTKDGLIDKEIDVASQKVLKYSYEPVADGTLKVIETEDSLMEMIGYKNLGASYLPNDPFNKAINSGTNRVPSSISSQQIQEVSSEYRGIFNVNPTEETNLEKKSKDLDDKSQANQPQPQKSLGNGKGLDDKLLAMQHKSLGNGKGLDDKLQAKQQAEERVAKVARTKGKGQNA